MPRLAALASAADNICFASSSVRLAYVRGMSPHLNTDRIHCHRGMRRVVGHSNTLNPDGLRVHESVRTEVRKLAPVAAVFDAAYGYAWVGCSNAIDENTSRIQIACNLASQFDIFGPEITAQPELACVRRLDGRIDVAHTGHRGNRAKGLLIERGHPLGHSAQLRRHIKGALAWHRLAAAQDACSFGNAALYLLVQSVAKVGASHRSHLHCRIERIADTDRLGCLNKQMLKLLRDFFQQDEAFGRQTYLPRVMKAPFDASRNCLGNIRIFTDNESIRSAQLHHGLLD